MTIDKAELNRWNERFSKDNYEFGTEPAGFLPENKRYLPAAGTALCVADGEGRNSVWLAKQGLAVTAFDFSPPGLAKARKLAESAGVAVDYRLADINAWDWASTQYDVIAAIFIQFVGPIERARIFAGFIRALKPGGVLLLHGYNTDQLKYGTGGPKQLENLYTTALLRDAFAPLEMLRLESYEKEISEGQGHVGMSALLDLVARKPA
jgi:2-polyprenyl-3-methyl-5-hydroxy-6-metoxy-1,4-benzoquinol methylase